MTDLIKAFILLWVAIVVILVAVFVFLIPGLILQGAGKLSLWLGEWLLDGFGVFQKE